MGRHRHAINVRADGLAAVLGPLLRDRAVRAATLVDVDSGMVLDACLGGAADGAAGGAPGGGPAGDLELLGAGHAELVRVALGLLWSGECEVVIGVGGGRHHVARTVPDPHGDRLALAVVVDGPLRAAKRTMRRLREVSQAALTAGPTNVRRPVMGAWGLPPTEQRIPLPGPRMPGPSPHAGPPLGPSGPGDPAISLFNPGAAPRLGPDGATAAVVLGRLAPVTPSTPAPVPAPVGRPDPAADQRPPTGGGAPAVTGPRPPAPPSALPPAPRGPAQPGAAGNGVERPH